MKISDLEALLKELRERHSDLSVRATLGPAFTGVSEAEEGDLEREMVRVDGDHVMIG